MTDCQKEATEQLALAAKQAHELRAAVGSAAVAGGDMPIILNEFRHNDATYTHYKPDYSGTAALIAKGYKPEPLVYLRDARAFAAQAASQATIPAFLPELFRWLARARFERPADEATAARFGAQMRDLLTTRVLDQPGIPTASGLADAQITAGAAILCDCPKPKRIGRNAAISVFEAMQTAGGSSTEDAVREHLARVFDAMPANETLRGSEIAGQIRAGKESA
jgi:hypothetical protein